MKKITRRDFLKGSAAGIASLCMTGFAPGLGIVSAEESSYVKDEITLQVSQLPSLNPFGTDTPYPAIMEMYESLFIVDGFGGDLVPLLADANRGEYGGYDHEEGSSDYTVYIYDYITDSAGNKLTASDIKFSYDLIASSYETNNWGDFESIEVVDDTTVIFHFAKEMTDLGALVDIWSPAYMVTEAAYDASATQLTSDVCGTGPYVVDSYTEGVTLSVVAREDYWQTDASLTPQLYKQNVTKINFEIITEEAQSVIALKTGDVDIATEISADNIADFEDGGSFADDYNVYSYRNNGSFYVLPNCSSDSLCSDENLRKALFYAIDVNGIAQGLGTDSVSALNCIGSDLFADYNSEWDSWENYQTVCDTDLAKDYLSQSAYNGETLKMLTTSETTNVCQIILQMWQNIGVSAELVTCDNASFNAFQGDSTAWDLQINARGSSNYLVVLWEHLYSLDNTDTGMTINFVDDAEWSALLETLQTQDGHTTENMDAWWQTCLDNAYGMGIYCVWNHTVYSSSIEELAFTNRNNVMPGGCIYVAE